MRSIHLTLIFFFSVLLTTYAIAYGIGMSLNTSESGIEGQVSIGTICQVERPDQPCPDKHFAASIKIQNKEVFQNVREITVRRHTATEPRNASTLVLPTSICAHRRADQLEEDVSVLLHAVEELKGFAACAVSGDRDVGGGMDRLIPAYGLAAQEVACVLVRGAISRRGRVAFARQLAAQVRGQQTVSDRYWLRQPCLKTVAAGAVADQHLPVHIEVFGITVVEDLVFREAGGIIYPDSFLALRLRAGVECQVV